MTDINYDYYYENIEVTKVTDGDTFHVKATRDIGFNVSATAKVVIRLSKIDTPEIYRPRNEAELKHGQEAKQFCEKVFAEATQIDMHSFKSGRYGRWIAKIYIHSEEGGEPTCLEEMLKANGFEKMESYE